MASDPVHIGAGKLYVGGTLPVGALPTSFTLSSGVPNITGATLINFTQDGIELDFGQTVKDVIVDQSLSPYRSLITSEEVTITTKLLEHDFVKLEQFLNGMTTTVNTTATPDQQEFTFGGSSTINYFNLAIVSADIQAPTEYTLLNFYKVAAVEGLKFKYGRTDETSFEVKLRAYADLTRAEGAQVMSGIRQFS